MNIINTISKYLMESKNSSKVAIINAMEIYFDYMGDDPIYNKQSEMDKEMLSDKTKKEYFAEELATPDKI